MKVISVMNYKGGVGKTTFTACTAQALALTGFRVLVIDNDGQHDLSTMLHVGTEKPTIRDIYHDASIGPASQRLIKTIRQTDLPCLHAIPSENDLCNHDVTDPYLLRKCFAYAMLHRFYDYVLIDNAPGMDALQISSVHAADEIFVPTELMQFALNGIRDMHSVLQRRYPDACTVTRIIPIFYRDTKAQNRHREALQQAFPGKVTQTSIPYDSVFDDLVSEGKNLFLHRLASKGAAYYLKIIHELFGLDESKTWQMVMERRQSRPGAQSRERKVRKRAGDAEAVNTSDSAIAAEATSEAAPPVRAPESSAPSPAPVTPEATPAEAPPAPVTQPPQPSPSTPEPSQCAQPATTPPGAGDIVPGDGGQGAPA